MATGSLMLDAPYGRAFLADPLFDIHREMNRLFDDALRGGSGGSGGASSGPAMAMPRIDVHESQGELCISADLPGLSQRDVELRLDGDVLTLSGERRQDQSREQRGYHVMERSHGRFRRSIRLGFAPTPADVDARFEDGVLTVTVPRRSQEERHRRIEIRGGGSDGGARAPGLQGANPPPMDVESRTASPGEGASGGMGDGGTGPGGAAAASASPEAATGAPAEASSGMPPGAPTTSAPGMSPDTSPGVPTDASPGASSPPPPSTSSTASEANATGG